MHPLGIKPTTLALQTAVLLQKLLNNVVNEAGGCGYDRLALIRKASGHQSPGCRKE